MEGCGEDEAGPAETRAQRARARSLTVGSWRLGHRNLAASSGHCLIRRPDRSVGRSRSECAALQTPAEDAGRRGSPACATRRCPGRAPQPPTLRPARRTPLPSPPEPESRSATWAAWLGVPGQQEAVHGGGTCSRHARELTACGRARARGAPLLARPRASRPMIFGKKSANGQSGVYFQSANNDFFSRVKRQCLRARSGGF